MPDQPVKTQKAKHPAPEIAKRALEEAKVRRDQIDKKANDAPKEVNGRGGLDPNRYGDWEIKGLTSDF